MDQLQVFVCYVSFKMNAEFRSQSNRIFFDFQQRSWKTIFRALYAQGLSTWLGSTPTLSTLTSRNSGVDLCTEDAQSTFNFLSNHWRQTYNWSRNSGKVYYSPECARSRLFMLFESAKHYGSCSGRIYPFFDTIFNFGLLSLCVFTICPFQQDDNIS